MVRAGYDVATGEARYVMRPIVTAERVHYGDAGATYVRGVDLLIESGGELVDQLDMRMHAHPTVRQARHVGDELVRALEVSPRLLVHVSTQPSFIRGDASKPVEITAVMDIDDRASVLDARARTDLSTYLSTRVAEQIGPVVPRAEIQALIRDEKLSSYDACFDESCQIELGKALAAGRVLARSARPARSAPSSTT